MVRAVRGATTVENNTSEEILRETEILLKEMVEVNNIDKNDIISVFFTVTQDLDAVFPAVAARKIGWENVALMCSNEMAVRNSLDKCIRVLLHFNTDKANSELKYIYLKNARRLRPDLFRDEFNAPDKQKKDRINIAIDGPAGAGKSTIAKHVSKILGIIYLDTGAMYRAFALKAIRTGIDTKDHEKLSELSRTIDIKIKYEGSEQKIILDGNDVSGEIRTPEVSLGASDVAVVPAVRMKLVELQREIALENDVVMDGRDIGTYVLPNASNKFFLTASLEERVNRRFGELEEKGNKIPLDEVRKDMEYRDKNDSSRAFAPLSKADDAVLLDTSDLSISQVAEKIMGYINMAGR